MATFYLDPQGGNDANDGTTFANRWKTVINGATAARIAPGDEIRVIGSFPKSDTGVNATFTNKSDTVTLDSALNVLITDCETNWTASANVTATTSTARKSGSNSVQLAIAAGFTTGKVAYFDLGSNQNYSAYQGITFYMESNVALNAGVLQIRLCSDTVGDVAVDTLSIPYVPYPSTAVWSPYYIDKGSALGSAIRSIAVYANSDPGTVTIKIDNFSTVKAKGANETDNLNLTSLISSGATGLQYPVRSINGTTVRIDLNPLHAVSGQTVRGWAGTTGSFDFYKQEPVRVDVTVGFFSSMLAVQDSGVAGNPITFSGGWNRSDMSAQNSETWLDGLHSYSIGWGGSSKNYITIRKINLVRWYQGVSLSTMTNWDIGDIRIAGCQSYGLALQTSDAIIGNVEVAGTASSAIWFSNASKVTVGNITCHGWGTGSQAGLDISTSGKMIKLGNLDLRNSAGIGISYDDTFGLKIGTITGRDLDGGIMAQSIDWEVACRLTIGDIDGEACGSNGFIFPGVHTHNNRFGTINMKNGTYGVRGVPGPGTRVKAIQTSGNSTAGWYNFSNVYPAGAGRIKTNTHTDATKYLDGSAIGTQSVNDYITIRNWENVAGAHRVRFGSHSTPSAEITPESGANRHTLSGLGWKLAILDDCYTAEFPLRYRLGTIYCAANALVTLRLWINRSNTNLVVRLAQPTLQIAGVTVEAVDTAAGSAGTWEELEITFTPTENGVIHPELRAYASNGVTTYTCYFDDMTITQA